jgi:hypothetical protein
MGVQKNQGIPLSTGQNKTRKEFHVNRVKIRIIYTGLSSLDKGFMSKFCVINFV